MAKSPGSNRALRRSGGGTLPKGGGGPGGGGGNPLAQAQEMLARAQEEMASATVEGTAGGGAIRIAMNGKHEITGITISPDVVDPEDVEMLQDLIMAAIADAAEKANELQSRAFSSILPPGLNLPGLGLG